MTRTLPARSASVADLSAHRRRRDGAFTRVAEAAVQHITPEFLAALNCRAAGTAAGVDRRHLRAV